MSRPLSDVGRISFVAPPATDASRARLAGCAALQNGEHDATPAPLEQLEAWPLNFNPVEFAATTRSRTCRARRSALVSGALHSCAARFFALPYARVGLTPSHALVVRVACAAIHVRTAVYYLPMPFECDARPRGRHSRVARRRPRARRAAATRRTGAAHSRSRGRGRAKHPSLRARAPARGGGRI